MTNPNQGTELVIRAHGHSPELKLRITAWSTAKNRLHESERLVPGNYTSLEYCFQEAWRECKSNCVSIGDAINKAEKTLEEVKADIILEEIPKLLEDKPKSANNADFRKAVFAKNEDYQKALEHLHKLEALLAHFEGHMKTMENTCRYLKKQMDYFIRSGVVERQ